MDLASNLQVKMKFPNLRSLCMLRPKMMGTSWTLRGMLQCILAKWLLKKKNDDNKMKKEESKGDEYIVGPYLRQRIENL